MEATVSKLASGIKLLLKSNRVNSVEGEAHIESQTKNKIVVNGETIESKNIVLATGSILSVYQDTNLEKIYYRPPRF